jgi:DHA1 family inner membrane transport protein
VSTFTYVTTETMPIGLLLLISKDLRSTPSAVGLLVTFYGLVVVVASIPLTQLTRRVPRRFLLSGLLAIFVIATLVSAMAPTYSVLLAVRVITALSQALFWSIVIPTATGLFPPKVRGRVISMVFAGGSLATVLGVPAGTWLGQQAGWRMSFVALSGIGLLALLGVARLLPTEPPGQGEASRGVTPDARRYWLLMAMTTLAVTGAFVVYTYVTPFLTDVGKFSLAAIGPLLLVRGVAGLAGVTVGGPLVDRNPWAAMVIPIVLQALAMFGLFLFGDKPIAAIALLAASGLSFAVLTTALGSRVLEVAPGSVDLAAAGCSTAVNVGITAGAFIGSILLPGIGVRSTTLVGGVLSLAALAIVLAEPLLASGVRQRDSSTPPAAGIREPDLAPSPV